MNVGDRIKFQFAGQEKEGIVERIFAKKIYLKVDFPGHPGKKLIRSVAALEGKAAAPKKRKVKAQKAKAKRAQSTEEKTPPEKKEAEKEGKE